MKPLERMRTAGIIQLAQTIITIVFVITSNIPTSVMSKLPMIVDQLSLLGFLGAFAAPVTSVVTFYYLIEGKRAGETSKLKIPIICFAVVNFIVGAIWIGLWVLIFVGAMTGNIHV